MFECHSEARHLSRFFAKLSTEIHTFIHISFNVQIFNVSFTRFAFQLESVNVEMFSFCLENRLESCPVTNSVNKTTHHYRISTQLFSMHKTCRFSLHQNGQQSILSTALCVSTIIPNISAMALGWMRG